MKSVSEMTSAAEVQQAYTDAVRNMSWNQIKKFSGDSRELPEDIPLIAHAKACMHKLQSLGVPA